MSWRARSVAENAALNSARVRQRMVERVREMGVRDERVLDAMAAVPRGPFLDDHNVHAAYEDRPVDIGYGQTMSQPYMVARSAELAIASMLTPRTARVLEIGTGCGYAAAVFAQLFGEIYTIERVRRLHEDARRNLRPFRLPTVRLVYGDGMEGLPGDAPFNAIIAAAAGSAVPDAWKEQLTPGGVIVAPIGEEGHQQLSVLSKDRLGRWTCQPYEPVRFVPLKRGIEVA